MRKAATTTPESQLGCSRIFRNSSSVPGRARQEILSQRRTQPRNWTTTFAQKVRQSKVLKGLESTTPLRPQQELEELRLKKENSRKQQTWIQSPKGMTKHRQSQKHRQTKGSKARTPSQNLLGHTPEQLVNSQEPSFRKATTGQNGTRVLRRLGAFFMVPGIDYPRYVHLGALIARQSDYDRICKLCARKGTEVAQGDSDVTQTSSLSEAGQ